MRFLFSRKYLALKFLDLDYLGPYTGFKWPRPLADGSPGFWIQADGGLVRCKNGIHAVTAAQSVAWASRTLFLIEVQGVRNVQDKLVAKRGRLIREVSEWDYTSFWERAHSYPSEHVMADFLSQNLSTGEQKELDRTNRRFD